MAAESVDLQARSRTWQAQEDVLLKLMSQASTVADTLRVQRELQDVQLTIERLKGQQRVLDDQVANATIEISIGERRAPTIKAPTVALPRFGDTWRSTVRGFLTVVFWIVIGLGYLAPLVLLGVLGLLVHRRTRLTA